MSNHPYIEHPHTIGAQNKHMLDATANAYAASLALAERGFTITSMHVEGARPVIFVQSMPDIKQRLGGAGLYMIKPTDGGRDLIYAAPFRNCQIKWRQS